MQASELWPPEAFLLNLKLLHERTISKSHQDRVGPDLHHLCTSPTLSEFTHRYMSTRTKNSGSNNIICGEFPRIFSKSPLGLSVIALESKGTDYVDDDFYDCR